MTKIIFSLKSNRYIVTLIKIQELLNYNFLLCYSTSIKAKEIIISLKKASSQEPCKSPTRWSLPLVRSYKANFVAAIFSAVSLVGLGVVIRDSNETL